MRRWKLEIAFGGLRTRLATFRGSTFRMQKLLMLLACSALHALAHASEPDWVYLENEHLKLGVRKDAGACIGYLAGKNGRNVLNSYDHGRFVQQSYYGAADGSLWVKQPWRYNPVQGGDYKGTPSTLLAFEAKPASLYSKTQPRHWATGKDLPEVQMEQWITLESDVVHLRFRMTYQGTETHPPQHQEIPAVFVQPEYKTLRLFDGKEDRSWAPGWPNEHVKLPRHQAWYLNEKNEGIGVYVPAADEATCYRFGKEGDPSACSYIAPLTTFALTPGKTFEYEAWLVVGDETTIRRRFKEIALRREGATDRAK